MTPMTRHEFRAAGERLYQLHRGEASPSDSQLFQFLAGQLESDPRSVSRWVYGERAISGPVKVALEGRLELQG